jgi:hypothetical protein
MANKIEIDVIANDLASAAIDLVKNKLASMGNTAGMVGAIAVTAGVAMATALFKAADAAQTYDQQVKELMLRTGGTADETSRLIQVIDDVGIEYGTLQTAMKFAVKNGIEPNIQSLAALSDQYKALKSPVEQGQFLLEKFGKSGMEMTRAMDMGGAALLRMGASMKGGLILTEANIAASERYRVTLDNLDDTANGLQISLGNKVIPVFDDILKVVTANINAVDEFSGVFAQLDNIMKVFPNGADRAAQAMKLFGDAAAAAMNGNLPSFMQSTSMATSTATNGYIAMAQAMEAVNSAGMTQIEIDKQIQIEAANLSKALMGTLGSMQQLEGATVQAANAIVYNMMMAKWSVDGLTQAEFDLAMQTGVAMGIFSQKTADATIKINKMTEGVVAGTSKVSALELAIKRLEGKDIMITANLSGNAFSGFVTPATGTNKPKPKGNQANNATGTDGWKTVPSGFPNDTYRVGLTSGETYAVMTRSQSMGASGGGGGGGGTVINLTYAPAFSTASSQELLQNITPLLNDWYRRRLTS